MPDIGVIHPQIVHFVIALAYVGIIARIVSLLPTAKLSWASRMATLLIILSAGAGVLAAQSGTDAHEKSESMPGVRKAVQDHEDWGHKTRTLLLVLAGVEIVALAASRKPGLLKGLHAVSALGGLYGLYAVYEVGDLGGDIVYEYAGGVGTRSGDTVDVRHLLVAGLYNNARLDRQSGDKAGAARMIDELVRRMPNDPSVHMLQIESMIKDKDDARGALNALNAYTPAPDDRRGNFQKAMMTSNAYVALGHADSAKLTLEALKAKTQPGPAQDRIQQAIDHLPK